jgi:hypothetical protein
VFIVQVLKVLCFDTDLQVFILKVDSWFAGALAEFVALLIFLPVGFAVSVEGKELDDRTNIS